MSNFYGGPQGKSFEIKKIFSSVAQELKEDLNRGPQSPVGIEDFVFISYGSPNENKDSYDALKKSDTDAIGLACNGMLLQKLYITTSNKPAIQNIYGNQIIFHLDNENNIKKYEGESNYPEGYCYILVAQLQGEVPEFELQETRILDPNQNPSVEISLGDPADTLTPDITFSLPRAAKFFTGRTIYAEIPGKAITVTLQPDDEIRPGDYYIKETSGLIYLIISVEDNVANGEYFGCFAGLSNFIKTGSHNPYNEDGSPKTVVEIGESKLNKAKGKIDVEYTTAKVPSVNPSIQSIDPKATPSVDLIAQNDTINLDFSLPRGAQWHIWAEAGLPQDLSSYGIGDYVLVNYQPTDQSSNENHGNYYEVTANRLVFKGNLKGSNITLLPGVTAEVEVQDTANYSSIKNAVIEKLLNDKTFTFDMPANPQEVLPIEVTAIDGANRVVVSFWASYINNEWFLTQMTGPASLIVGRGEGEGTIVTDAASFALANNDIVLGAPNSAGRKAYYISAIDRVNKKIYLSNTQTIPPAFNYSAADPGWNIDTSFEAPSYAVGDEFSIIWNSHYNFADKIAAIENNVITWEGDFYPPAPTSDSGDDAFTFHVPSRPSVGVITFGIGAFATGQDNRANGRGTFVGGRNNIASGNYGAVFGRNNKVGYGDLVGGLGNTITGNNSFGMGDYNILKAGYSGVIGRKNVIKPTSANSGFGSFISGARNNVNATYSLISGWENEVANARQSDILGESNNVTDGFGVSVIGHGNITTGWKNRIIGSYNTILGERVCALGDSLKTEASTKEQTLVGSYNIQDDDARFIVGNGLSENKRKNAMVVKKSGETIFDGPILDKNNIPYAKEPDWNQNDATSAGYIKDRTHYTYNTIGYELTGDDYFEISWSNKPNEIPEKYISSEQYIEWSDGVVTKGTWERFNNDFYELGSRGVIFLRDWTYHLSISGEPGFDCEWCKISPTGKEVTKLAVKQLDKKYIPDYVSKTYVDNFNVIKNWQENDKNSLEYIKNRTHYDEYEIKTFTTSWGSYIKNETDNWSVYDLHVDSLVGTYIGNNEIVFPFDVEWNGKIYEVSNCDAQGFSSLDYMMNTGIKSISFDTEDFSIHMRKASDYYSADLTISEITDNPPKGTNLIFRMKKITTTVPLEERYLPENAEFNNLLTNSAWAVASGNFSLVAGHGFLIQQGYPIISSNYYPTDTDINNFSYVWKDNRFTGEKGARAESPLFALGNSSSAIGVGNLAAGVSSIATGGVTCAKGHGAFSAGIATESQSTQLALGQLNQPVRGNVATVNTLWSDTPQGDFTSGTALVVGNGSINFLEEGYNSSTEIDYSNAFKVNYDGTAILQSSLFTNERGYAEYYQWTTEELAGGYSDRSGCLVTLNGDEIKRASAGDFILGVITNNPAIIGNASDEHWQEKYQKDIFGRRIKETVNGITRFAINDGYNNENAGLTYPGGYQEDTGFGLVGLVGTFIVLDDGTCQVNNFATAGTEGIATAAQSQTNLRVIKRIDETHIQVIKF